MFRKTAIPILAILCLCSVLAAQEQVNITDVTIDKLLEGVRVTIVCSGNPNVSSFVSTQPPAVVIDVMDATSKLDRERIESSYYPVAAVSVEPSAATRGVRLTIRLRELVEHRVTSENGLVAVDIGTRPVMPAPAEEQKDAFAGKRLTLYVKDADITDVLRMIASQFGLNILTTQDVKSLVTVRLSDVPLRVGLDALVKAALANIVEDKSGILIVKPVKKEMYGETVTRVFDLDHIEAADVTKVITKLLSSSGNAEVGFRRIENGGGSQRGSIVVVTDLPEAVDRIASVIADLDQPVPQIAIEAKFIETTQSDEDRFGIQWTLGAAAASGPFDFSKDFGLPIVYNSMVLGKISLDQFNASMEIMASRGKSRVLASPKTITLDNQTSTVSMGTDVPLREISTDPRTGLVLATWRTRSVPIALEVTPHVTSEGKVTMKVKPSVEAITGYVGPPDDQRPIVARRTAETQVTVGDGEVAVIGGLVRDEETRNVGKIPLLGDIPILGNLFKKTSIKHEKSELMIFIIPHILPTEG
jgi:type IV pilus assembly protein PilQ